MCLGRGLESTSSVWLGSARLQHPLPMPGKGWGVVGVHKEGEADALALVPSRQRGMAQQMPERGKREMRMGPGVVGRGASPEGPILCQLGKPRTQRSRGPGHQAASRLHYR